METESETDRYRKRARDRVTYSQRERVTERARWRAI